MLTKRDKEALRLLKWLKRYSGWWYLICTPGNEHMTPNMMKMLIQRLAKKGFYEMIFVLIMVHREADFMKSALGYLLLDFVMMGRQQEGQGRESIIKQRTDLLTQKRKSRDKITYLCFL